MAAAGDRHVRLKNADALMDANDKNARAGRRGSTAAHPNPGDQQRQAQGFTTPPLPGGRLIGFTDV